MFYPRNIVALVYNDSDDHFHQNINFIDTYFKDTNNIDRLRKLIQPRDSRFSIVWTSVYSKSVLYLMSRVMELINPKFFVPGGPLTGRMEFPDLMILKAMTEFLDERDAGFFFTTNENLILLENEANKFTLKSDDVSTRQTRFGNFQGIRFEFKDQEKIWTPYV